MINIKRVLLFTILFWVFVSADLFAGSGMGMGGSGPCGGPFPPCPVPLDGGLSVLLAVGAAYGGKKIYDSFNKNPE